MSFSFKHRRRGRPRAAGSLRHDDLVFRLELDVAGGVGADVFEHGFYCVGRGEIDVDDVHGILFLQNGKKFFWLKRMTRLSAQDSAALGADRSAEE